MFEVISKVPIDDLKDLSLVYTPGVGHSCVAIKENKELTYELTNRANSIAIIDLALSSQDSFEKLPVIEKKVCEYIEKGIDAYPFIIIDKGFDKTLEIIQALEPNFARFDLSFLDKELACSFQERFGINVVYSIDDIEILRSAQNDDIEKYKTNPDFKQASLDLRKDYKGVIKLKNINIIPTENNVKSTVKKIKEDLSTIYTDTFKKNYVAILSDGSAVLGFGNIGPYAALPVMEGKAALFKALGGINAIPICLNEQNPDKVIEIAQEISPVFGGINLEDIGAPNCFKVEQELIKTLDIPVFHDDQHGTAIIVLAGLLNALKLKNKKIEEIKIVVNGAGAAGLAITKLLLKRGAINLTVVDKFGIAYPNRIDEMYDYKREIIKNTNPENTKGGLSEAIKGADVFIGVSAAGALLPEYVKSMNIDPVIFALANPTPEIMPDIAINNGAYIIATGRSDFNNQVNNSLAFPGIFRGALDIRANKITDEMKLKAAYAIASLVPEDKLSKNCIIPNALDKNVPLKVAQAVKSK